MSPAPDHAAGPAPRVAMIYCSATGNVHALADAVRAGAEKAGAELPTATKDDLLWADAAILGTSTRFGLPASQLEQFIDTTGGSWEQGLLAGDAGRLPEAS